MSDTDATQARQDVVADVDEILEHVINANMLSMPYEVYFELFDAVAGLGVKVEKLQAENAKLRELVLDYEHCSMHADCDRCEYDGTTSTHCPLSPCFPDIDELHELGVEVE